VSSILRAWVTWMSRPFHTLGSQLAPPMWGMPALLGHCGIMVNAPL